MEAREALRRSRQVVAAVAEPALRRVLTEGAGSGAGVPDDPRTQHALAGFDWLGQDGAVDAGLLRRTGEALGPLLTDQAVLRFPRVEALPVEERRRRELSLQVVAVVFERLGVAGGVTEERLNAALRMLVRDPATVRRDAVDAGLLLRSRDGRAYAIRRPGRSGAGEEEGVQASSS